MPPELGDLASLKRLNLSYNALTGGHPAGTGDAREHRGAVAQRQPFDRPCTGRFRRARDPSVLRPLGQPLRLRSSHTCCRVAEHDLANVRFCLPPPSTSPALFNDCAVLLAVKDALAGDGSLNWHTATSVGSWQGVTVGRSAGRIVALDLRDMNLNGRLPPGTERTQPSLYAAARRQPTHRFHSSGTGEAEPSDHAVARRQSPDRAHSARRSADLFNLRQLLAGRQPSLRVPSRPNCPASQAFPWPSPVTTSTAACRGCCTRLARHDLDDALICIVLGNDRLWLWRTGFSESHGEAPPRPWLWGGEILGRRPPPAISAARRTPTICT